MSDDRPQGHPRDSDDDRVTDQDEGHTDRPSRAVPVQPERDDRAADDRSRDDRPTDDGATPERDAMDAEARRDEVEKTRDYTVATDAAPSVPTAEPPTLNEEPAFEDREVVEEHYFTGRDDDAQRFPREEPDAETTERPVPTTVTEHPVSTPPTVDEPSANVRDQDADAERYDPDADTHEDADTHDHDHGHDRPIADAHAVDEHRDTDSSSMPTAVVPTAPATRVTAATTPVVAPATPAYSDAPMVPDAASALAPAAAPAPAPAPIYVQAPVPPRKKGNRGVGILIAFAATLVFTLLYAIGAAALASITSPDAFGEPLARYLATPVFWIPVLVFFAAFALLIAIVNRANWWAYVLGGFPVAVIVYAAYIGARLIQQDITELTPSEAALVVQRVSTFPDGILAAVLAREIVIWAGAVISARGRRVKTRNAEARAEYDRKVAEAPGM